MLWLGGIRFGWPGIEDVKGASDKARQLQRCLALCSIMLNILGEAGGEEGVQKAHEVMSRAYAVSSSHVLPLPAPLTAVLCRA